MELFFQKSKVRFSTFLEKHVHCDSWKECLDLAYNLTMYSKKWLIRTYWSVGYFYWPRSRGDNTFGSVNDNAFLSRRLDQPLLTFQNPIAR